MKKIIDYGKVWTCENMDDLAPINWEGYKVLFSDGEIKVINSLDEIIEYERANTEEYKDFYRERNFIFVGDEVEIIKGRKLPIGEHKIVEDFYIYKVPDTYGHKQTEYIIFADGTKTDIVNVKNVKCKMTLAHPKKFVSGYSLSGRM